MGDDNDRVVEELDAYRESLEGLQARASARATEVTGVIENALADLGREVRARLVQGEGGDGDSTDWMALFEELRKRSASLGISERSGRVDDFGMDPELVQRAEPLLRLLAERWWRIDVHGLEDVPADAPLLFVANRSGVLPYDGMMISHVVGEGLPVDERPRFLVADWLATKPFAQPILSRLGAVRACQENAERLLASGRSVVAFPEGQKGATKVFRDRYRLQRFGRGGVVRLALEMGVPLVPVAVIGAEETHPVLFKVETWARTVGLPFVPVTPTFPLLGPLGLVPLPSKWSIRFGAPLDLGADTAPTDALAVTRLTEELRQEIARLVDEGLRGREGVFA